MHPNEVDSVVHALMLDDESTTLEFEEDEDPPEVILEDNDDTLEGDLPSK